MPNKIQPGGEESKGWRSEIGASLQPSAALAIAMIEIVHGHGIFHLHQKTKLATDPAKHVDANVIRTWLARHEVSEGFEEFDVVVWLARAVRGEWAVLPHRTPSRHRKLYQRIAQLCHELRDLMDETGGPYRQDANQGLMGINVRSLFTENENAEFEAAYKHPEQIYSRSGSGDEFIDHEPELPYLDEVLERVAFAAERLERHGPLHAQPNKRGAERGYFVRRIGELFKQRYGEQPHEVIAALTTIALGEATDRELVAKLLA